MGIAFVLWLVLDPTPFVSKECKFSVNFPSAPQATERTVNGVTTRKFQLIVGSESYSVTHAILPSKSGRTPKELFDGAVLGMKRAGRKVTLSEDGVFGEKKHPSRMIEVNNGEAFVRMRFVIVGDRMYQVSVGGEEGFLKTPKAKTFFESFAIKP